MPERQKPEQPEFERTTCDCAGCRVGCKTMPGMLGIGDVQNIAEYLGRDPDASFLTAHFQHSTGAKLAMSRAPHVVIQVPTIVPARKPDTGTCVFLDDDTGYCNVHPVSPYGCRHFDVHQTIQEGDARVMAGIVPVALEQQSRGEYFKHLRTLMAASKQAPPVAESRAKMDLELRLLRHAGLVSKQG